MQHENVYFMRWELLLRGKTKGFSFTIPPVIPLNVIKIFLLWEGHLIIILVPHCPRYSRLYGRYYI